MTNVQTLFRRAFGHTPPRVLQVPLPLELMGGYTEAHQGLVLSLAIDQFVEVAFVPRQDGRIEVVRDTPKQRKSIWPSDCEAGLVPGWLAPVAAIINKLRAHGRMIRGFNAAILSHTDDSSPVVLAAALMLREMFPFGLRESGLGPPPKQIKGGTLPGLNRSQCLRLAKLCAEAERSFSLGDGFSQQFIPPLLNRSFETTQIDCLHGGVESHPLAGEFAWLVCDTGVRDSRHAFRRGKTDLIGRKAAKKLGVQSLRSVQVADLQGTRSSLTEEDRKVVRFVVGECARSVAVESTLRAGDILQMGDLINQSQHEARTVAGITTPEIDLLTDLAREHPACIGARFTGNGSAGLVYCLVAWRDMKAFGKKLAVGFRNQTGFKLTYTQVKSTDGIMAGKPALSA